MTSEASRSDGGAGGKAPCRSSARRAVVRRGEWSEGPEGGEAPLCYSCCCLELSESLKLDTTTAPSEARESCCWGRAESLSEAEVQVQVWGWGMGDRLIPVAVFGPSLRWNSCWGPLTLQLAKRGGGEKGAPGPLSHPIRMENIVERDKGFPLSRNTIFHAKRALK